MSWDKTYEGMSELIDEVVKEKAGLLSAERGTRNAESVKPKAFVNGVALD